MVSKVSQQGGPGYGRGENKTREGSRGENKKRKGKEKREQEGRERKRENRMKNTKGAIKHM